MDNKIWIALITALTTATVVYLSYISARRSGGAVKSDTLRILSVMVAVTASVMAIVGFVLADRSSVLFQPSADDPAIVAERTEVKLRAFEAVLRRIEKQQMEGPKNEDQNAALSALTARLSQLEATTGDLKGLFLNDAQLAVTLPLIKREIDSLRAEITSQKADIAAIRALAAETTAQGRWIIGTLAVGMLGLVLPVARSLFVKQAAVGDSSKNA